MAAGIVILQQDQKTSKRLYDMLSSWTIYSPSRPPSSNWGSDAKQKAMERLLSRCTTQELVVKSLRNDEVH
jgi:hypothetical protein